MARALVMRIVRAKWFAPLCLFALALFVRVVPIFQHSFDGLYGQDAYAYFEYARELFAALSQARVPPPFWWSLGYPFLLDAAFLFGGMNAASAQGITMLYGAGGGRCVLQKSRGLGGGANLRAERTAGAVVRCRHVGRARVDVGNSRGVAAAPLCAHARNMEFDIWSARSRSGGVDALAEFVVCGSLV